MKKFDYKDIGFFGNPITSLTREKLLEAFSKLAAILYECSEKEKKLKDYIFIKRNDEDKIRLNENGFQNK